VSRHFPESSGQVGPRAEIWLVGSLAHPSRRGGQLGEERLAEDLEVEVLSAPNHPDMLFEFWDRYSDDYWHAYVGPPGVDSERDFHVSDLNHFLVPRKRDAPYGMTVEIVLDSADDSEFVTRALVDEILVPHEAELLMRIVRERFDAAPFEPNLRRPTQSVGFDWLGQELKSTELYIPTVPFRDETTATSNDFQCQRILRFIKSENLMFWLWSKPVVQDWSHEFEHDLRGIPRISTAALIDPVFMGSNEARFDDCIEHIEYCLESLGASMSQWQSNVMGAIASESEVFEISEFDSLRTEFGRIGSGVGMTESSLRANVLRAKVDSRVLSSRWVDFLDKWEKTSDPLRDRQSDMAALLASLATGLQAYSADKLSNRFGIVAATVLLPSLVLAFFGANLDILSQGAHGQLLQVLLWCVIAVVISSIFLVRQVDRYWLASLLVGVVAAAVAFLLSFRHTNWSALLPMFVLSLSLLTLGLVGRLRSKNGSGSAVRRNLEKSDFS
jgi:hypothetical protein